MYHQYLRVLVALFVSYFVPLVSVLTTETSFTYFDKVSPHTTTTSVLQNDSSLIRKLLNSSFDIQIADFPKNQTIFIGGLFDLTNTPWRYGLSELFASRLAVRHVNDLKILGKYQLKLLASNAQCDNGISINALYNIMYVQNKIQLIMGPSCSEVAENIAQIAQTESLVQISFGSTSPALSEREKFPNFFRMCEADSTLNHARRLFLQNFNWDRVATFTQNINVFKLAEKKMAKTFELNGIKAVGIDWSVSEIQERLITLNETGARIFFGKFREPVAQKVFCEVYHQKLFGPKYVWILPKIFSNNWWSKTHRNNSESHNCTADQLKEAIQGYFAVDVLGIDEDESDHQDITEHSDSSLVWRTRFRKEFLMGSPRPISPYSRHAYDAIWTAVNALEKIFVNSSPPQIDRLLQNMTQLLPIFLNTIQNLNFYGVSGSVSFDGSDRLGISGVFQNQDGVLKKIAVLVKNGSNAYLDFQCIECFNVVWQGPEQPVDEITCIYRPLLINRRIFVIVTIICSIGAVLSIGFFCFNWHFQYLKYIKLSSPRLNNMAVLGCLVVYISVISIGLDDNFLNPHDYRILCPIRTLLFASGFTFQFGSMFAKTFRVYVIFRRAYRGVMRKNILRDAQLMGMVGAIFVIDLCITTSWALADPMHRKVTNLTHQAYTHDDTRYIPQRVTCYSVHINIWSGLLCAYKGLLLIFGVYMAWSTRSVHIPILNDSKFIGLSVYNVVLASLLVLVLLLLLSDRPTQLFVVCSFVLIVSTTVTLLLLFLPKIFVIIKSNGNPAVQTSALFQEASTRTFPFDDRREKLQRAEIQNRVFKGELLSLQSNIERMENVLCCPIVPYSILTNESLDDLPEFFIDMPNTKKKTPPIGSIVPTSISDEDLETYVDDSGIFSTSLKSNNTANDSLKNRADRMAHVAASFRAKYRKKPAKLGISAAVISARSSSYLDIGLTLATARSHSVCFVNSPSEQPQYNSLKGTSKRRCSSPKSPNKTWNFLRLYNGNQRRKSEMSLGVGVNSRSVQKTASCYKIDNPGQNTCLWNPNELSVGHTIHMQDKAHSEETYIDVLSIPVPSTSKSSDNFLHYGRYGKVSSTTSSDSGEKEDHADSQDEHEVRRSLISSVEAQPSIEMPFSRSADCVNTPTSTKKERIRRMRKEMERNRQELFSAKDLCIDLV